LPLPAVGSDGDEFHLFEIATARGGNGVSGNDYWAVVVRPAAVWATGQPFADGQLLAAQLMTSVPTTLVVEEPATTTAAGARYTVKFGATSKVVLPMLPSSVVSKTTTVLVGDLQGGFHASSYRPFVSVGDKWTLIDDNGSCRVPALGEDMGQVRLSAEVSKWTDGRMTLKCLSIQR
jgi:hypothetical protein